MARRQTARQTASTLLLLLCLTACAAAAGGCSSFEREWKAAAELPVETNDITGRWQGEWTSDASGHHGGLRCVITKVDEQTYNARFRASWGWIFRFGYEMPLWADRREGDYTHFSGEADLGWPGVYRYEGKASATEFVCEYETKNDYGRFVMTRPGVKGNDRVEAGEGAEP